MPRKITQLVREQRRTGAQERDARHAALSLEDRVLLCESRPGESRREKARLFRLIEERDRATLSAGKGKKGKKDA